MDSIAALTVTRRPFTRRDAAAKEVEEALLGRSYRRKGAACYYHFEVGT